MIKILPASEVRKIHGVIVQEGRCNPEVECKDFQGYWCATPGGGCWIKGNLVEVEADETDHALGRQSFSMEWDEAKYGGENFHTSCSLFCAIREGKRVVLFRIYPH